MAMVQRLTACVLCLALAALWVDCARAAPSATSTLFGPGLAAGPAKVVAAAAAVKAGPPRPSGPGDAGGGAPPAGRPPGRQRHRHLVRRGEHEAGRPPGSGLAAEWEVLAGGAVAASKAGEEDLVHEVGHRASTAAATAAAAAAPLAVARIEVEGTEDGGRRLAAEDWESIKALRLDSPYWMAHATVQRCRLFNLTLPGSHGSGIYGTGADDTEEVGPETQQLSVGRQLWLGVRAFDLRVAWSFTEKCLFVSHGHLKRPLAPVLAEMSAFLASAHLEVIVVRAQLDWGAYVYDSRHLSDLLAEDQDPKKVPGQTMHEEMAKAFGQMLATYRALSLIPESENMENPTVESLVKANARVIYFWNGQQVLCLTREECLETPGWEEPWDGLAFGKPMPLGVRPPTSFSTAETSPIEPACMANSWEQTHSDQPLTVVQRLSQWSSGVQEATAITKPTCFPPMQPLPQAHQPTLFYWAECILTPDGSAAHDAMVVRRSAERLNYILLMEFFGKTSRHIFRGPNVLSMDYVAPALVQRIVEANQGKKDCDVAIFCGDDGLCHAATRGVVESDYNCLSEKAVEDALRAHFNAEDSKPVLFPLLVAVILPCLAALGALAYWRLAIQPDAKTSVRAKAAAAAPPPEPGAARDHWPPSAAKVAKGAPQEAKQPLSPEPPAAAAEGGSPSLVVPPGDGGVAAVSSRDLVTVGRLDSYKDYKHGWKLVQQVAKS